MKTPTITGVQGNLFGDFPTDHHLKQQKIESSHVFDMMDALQSPILTFSPQWKDTIPTRILDIIPEARIAALFKNEELATLEECFVYIYTRTLDAPLDHEWTDIYTHIGCKILELRFAEDHWEEMRAPKELSDWLHSKLNGLRRHIYNKRREILKKQHRNHRKTD